MAGRKERLSEEEAREREELLRARGFQPERPVASTVTLLERRKRDEETSRGRRRKRGRRVSERRTRFGMVALGLAGWTFSVALLVTWGIFGSAVLVAWAPSDC